MTTELEKLIEESRWRDIEDAPKGKRVLIAGINSNGKTRTLNAEYIEKHSLLCDSDDIDYGDEFNGELYSPEGWYEYIDSYSDWCYYPLEIKPTHFRPLPDDRLADACRVLLDAMRDIDVHGNGAFDEKAEIALQSAEQIAKGEVK